MRRAKFYGEPVLIVKTGNGKHVPLLCTVGLSPSQIKPKTIGVKHTVLRSKSTFGCHGIRITSELNPLTPKQL